MQISYRNKLLSLFTSLSLLATSSLLSTDSADLATANQQATSVEADKTAEPTIPKELISALTQLEENCQVWLKLDNELNYLILYINGAHIKGLSVGNVEKINVLVRHLRSAISQTLREKSIIASIGNANIITEINYKFADFCDVMANHINALLESKLQAVNEFDFELLAKRSVPTTIDEQLVKEKIDKNRQKITALRHKIDTVGLTWYNKVARKFDDKIVTPWQKYGLSKGLKVLSVTGLVALIAAWEYGAAQTSLQWEAFQKDHMLTPELKNITEKLKANTIEPELLNAVCPPYFLNTDKTANLEKWLGVTDVSALNTSKISEDATKLEILARDIYLYTLRNQFEINPIFKWIFDTFGYPYPVNKGWLDRDELHRNPKNYGSISALMNFAHNVLSNHLPIVSLLGGYALARYTQLWQGEGDKEKKDPTAGLKGKISVFVQQQWNNLRGGLHKNQQINGIWDFEPKITFDDVIGLNEAKMTLSAILEFVENMEMNMNINIAPEMGYLLTGKTRTGKTYIFEALCGEIVKRLHDAGKPNTFKFKIIPAEHIIQFGIRSILEWAKDEAPILLFIDEIDLLDVNRIGNKTLLCEFLTAIGSAFNKDPKKPVIIISATNKPENLDAALRTSGRLGKEIRFERPPLAIRNQYLVHEFNKMAIDASNFDINALAQKTAGASLEDLHTMIAAAIRNSWMYGQMLSQELLEFCIDTELRHIIQIDHKKLSDTEHKILAIHFAGRALAGRLLDLVDPLDMVTIKPIMTALEEEVTLNLFGKKNKDASVNQKIEYGALFTKQLCDTIQFKSYDQTLNDIKLLVAGFAAEELIFGNCAYTCHANDNTKALLAARALVFEGLDAKLLSKQQLQELSEQAYKILKQCKEEVKALLVPYTKSLNALAEALMVNKTLTAEYIQFISDVAEGKIDIEKLKAEIEAEQLKLKQAQHPAELASMVQPAASA